MDQVIELFQKSFNLESGLVYFPVRHFSPACSFHLLKTIEEYQPEVILIEGPSDTNHLLPFIIDQQTKAPFSLYYSYADNQKLISEEQEKFSCYYPFLDYSSELQALKKAQELEIPAQFIDLPYPQILLGSKEGRGVRKGADKETYNDDSLINQSLYIKSLCQKENCRDFNELWEKLYELDGLKQSSADFVKNLLGYCYFSRISQSEESLKAEACLIREEFMAGKIQEFKKDYNKILVVTGGFHVLGLVELENKKLKTKTKKFSDSAAYLMPYSFHEADQLSGYASGMPHPAFYQKVWENIQASQNEPYLETVLNFITECGRTLRKEGEGNSTADSIEALNMARGLALLRSKYEAGVYELTDSIRSAFIKGELDLSHQKPLEVLGKLLAGNKVGAVSDQADLPPLILDFKARSKKLKLKLDSSLQEKELDLYKKQSHKESSHFFHLTRFLNTGFCKKLKGPDFAQRKNINLVRETWYYQWFTGVETKLLEYSVYGASLAEAAKELLKDKLRLNPNHAETVSYLLLEAVSMGLEDLISSLLKRLKIILQQDGLFFSLATACSNFFFLYREGWLLGVTEKDELKELIKSSFEKSSSLISGLSKLPPEQVDLAIEKLKSLYVILNDLEFELETDIYREQLLILVNNQNNVPALEGAAVGILVSLNAINKTEAVSKAKAYLFGGGEQYIFSAAFLRGLFSSARELLLYDQTLIQGIDKMLTAAGYEDFLQLLPELRQAFSFFTPAEIAKISSKVASLYKMDKREFKARKAFNEMDIKLAEKLNSLALEKMTDWGIV